MDLSAMVTEMQRDLKAMTEESLREDVRRVFDFIQNEHTDQAPVQSGRYRSELQFYRNSMPEDELYGKDKPFYPPPGHDQIDAVMDTWQVGEEVGFVDNAPYAERIAEGWSDQAAAGWLDTITADAVALPFTGAEK